MMYSCAPTSGSSSAIVKSKKRGSLRIDIHCHYLNPDAAAKVAPLNPAQHEMQIKFANALTRETNKKQVAERAPKLSNIEVRLKDMDRMGIDIQAVSPAPQQTYYWTEPGMGAELARAGERAPGRDRGQVARALRRPGHRAAAGSGPGGVRTRVLRKKARHARRRDQRQRQRHGPHRRPARPGEVLRQGAGARRHHLHASHRLHAGRAPARPLLQQRDRQSARDHGGGEPPDLRRGDGPLSRSSRWCCRTAAGSLPTTGSA